MKMKHYVRMAIMVCSVVMMCAVASIRNASAFDLYNDDALLSLLKKNQVLSEKDIVEVKSSYPKLGLMGNIQLQYAKNSGSDDSSDLYAKRLNLTFVAHLNEQIRFVIEPEYGRGEPLVKDAYLAYKPSWLEVFAGNHRVPFGQEALKREISQTFAERNLVSKISPDYLPGVSVVKPLLGSKLLVQAGVWNGNINSKAESNLISDALADNQIFSASTTASGSNVLIEAIRIAYNSKAHDNFYTGGTGFEDSENFGGTINYGAGFSYYKSVAIHDVAASNGNVGLNGAKAYGLDATFKIWKLSTEFEYAKRTLDWWHYSSTGAVIGNTLVSSTQTAVSAQASLLLIGNLSLSTRYETFKYDDNGGVLKGAFGQDQDKWLTFGVNYYFREQHTKLQLNYVSKSETMPAVVKSTTPAADSTLYVQATMYF